MKQRSTMVRQVPKEPRKHCVIVLNDDFTSFEFVVDIMMTIFQKSQDVAWEIAETTHLHNKAKVGSYSLDIAKSKVAKATALAREAGFPLRFDIEPEYIWQ